MNCGRFKRLLLGFLYGELSPGDRERLIRHAAACPACRRLQEEMEGTVSRLSAVPGPAFSRREKELLRERVKAAVRPGPPVCRASPRSLPRLLLRPLFLPAALAAAVVLLVLFRETPRPAPSAPEAAALADLSEEVEEEFRLLADVWGEIEEIEALFSPHPVAGPGADVSEGRGVDRA